MPHYVLFLSLNGMPCCRSISIAMFRVDNQRTRQYSFGMRLYSSNDKVTSRLALSLSTEADTKPCCFVVIAKRQPITPSQVIQKSRLARMNGDSQMEGFGSHVKSRN